MCAGVEGMPAADVVKLPKDDGVAITKVADLRPEYDGREVTMIFRITGTLVSKGERKGEVPHVLLQYDGMKKSPNLSVYVMGELLDLFHRFAMVSPGGMLVGRSIRASGKITVFDTFAPPSDEKPQYILELRDWKKFQILPKPKKT